MARAGETVELAEREVTIHELTLVDWDDTDPERPIAILDVACSAGTYIRALARDLGEPVGSAAYLGALRRTGAGPFPLEDAVALDASVRPRPTVRPGSRRCSGRSTPASRRFPDVVADGRGVDGRRSGPVRPPGAGVRARRRALPAARARRRPGGHRRGRGRRAPGTDKVLVAAGRRARRRAGAEDVHVAGRRCACDPSTARSSWSSASSTACTAATPTSWSTSSARPGAGRRPTVITFDHHPDEVLTGSAPPLLFDPDERLERLAAAGVEVTVVQHFDEALRQTPYDAFVDAIRARTALAGLLMTPDAAFGYERRARRRRSRRSARARFRRRGRAAVHDRWPSGPQHATIRAAIAAATWRDAAALLGRPVALGGARDGRLVRCPMALPPDGEYRWPSTVDAARHGDAWDRPIEPAGDGAGRRGVRRRDRSGLAARAAQRGPPAGAG